MDIEVEIAEEDIRTFDELKRIRRWYLHMSLGGSILILLPLLGVAWLLMNTILLDQVPVDFWLSDLFLGLIKILFLGLMATGACFISCRHPDYDASDCSYASVIRFCALLICAAFGFREVASILSIYFDVIQVLEWLPKAYALYDLSMIICLVVSLICGVVLLVMLFPFSIVLTSHAEYQRLRLRYYFTLVVCVAVLLLLIKLWQESPDDVSDDLQFVIGHFLVFYFYQMLLWVLFSWILMELIQFMVVVIRRYQQSLQRMELQGIRELESSDSPQTWSED